ncbi:MAG: hypothetical protein GY856_05800, partial [bacterium]|nr:hypothetical protein [bacterium]
MVVDRFRRRLTGFRTVVLGGLALFAGLAWALFTLAPGWAEEIGFAELRIEGTTLRVDPLSHTVDLDMPTVINTHLDGYDPELGTLPPDLRVVGDFSGPEIDGVLLLETVPNEPFRIPALRVGGDYELANIRLVQGDQVLAYAEDDLASILVTQILLTSVSSRALTDDEIRSYGLVLDGENYQALNLTFAFNVAGRTVEYNMPVVYDLYGPNVRFRGLPSVQLPMFGGSGNTVRDYRFTPPRLVPFSVKLPESEREEVPTGGCDPSNGSCRDRLPPEFSMVGMILFPTEISLLHQYFSVVLSVQNGAPEGDLLVVRDLMAKINLPSGLRLGETEPPTLLGTPTPVRTADGDHRIEGQEQGDAEYLIEGTEAGTYVVRFDMEGFLEGLPGGVQRITGEAKGAVMVHDPYLSVRVAHPQTVREDIGYMVYFTVTNLGNAPVNNISIALPPAALSGVEILPEGGEVHYTKEIGSLLPGDSEVVGFPIQSKLTGRIISTAVNTGSSTKPEFQWSLQVGVAGALSGDSLSVPTSSDNLPSEILRPALALAGLGYSLAKAPSTVDSTLPRLSMAEVNERIYRLSEAGRNRELGEELFDALAILACELNGARDHGWNFDQLRREHQKGEELAAAVAAQLSSLVTSPEEAFERFAATTHFLGPQAVLAVGDGVTVEVASRISGKAVAGSGPERVRDLPFAELYDLAGDGIEDAEMVVLLNEQETGGYQVRLGHATGGLADLHLMVPDVAGELRMVRWTGVDLAAAAEAVVEFQREDEDFILAVDDEGDGLADFHLAGDVEYPAPRPFQAIVAVQDAVVDPSGHVIEVLFSEDVDLASLLHDNQRDPNHFVLPGNVSNGGLIQSEADILGSLLLGEPDIENRLAGFSNPRIVQVVFDNPVSPLVEQPHQLTISHLTSAGGRALGSEPQTVEVVTTATELAIAVEGTVIGPDGNPVPNAQVALRESDLIGTGGNKECLRHTTAATTTDADGRYRFDYVRQPGCDDLFEVKAQVPEPSAFWGTATGRVRIIEAEPLQLNVVMPGRGSLRGQVRYQDGTVPDEIHVVASNRNRNEGRLAHVDDNGFYDVDDVVVGTVTLAAYDAERNFVYRTVELPEAGAEVEQDLIIVRRDPSEPPPGQLHGTVLLAEGEDPELYPPAVDAYVALYVNDELIAVERSDLDGRFDFGLVPTGIAEIEAFSASSRLSGARLFVEIEPDHTTDQEIILKDDRGVVRGCVRRRFWQHGTEDEKVVGAVVWAHGTPFHATTDEDGCFELEDVFAGTWKIHAVDLKHNEATSAKATLTSGGEVDTMLYFDDALPQGGILGRVLSYDDTPVRGATIHLAGGYMSTNWHHDTSTDDGGYFKIEDLSAGVHGVHAMGGTAGEPGVAVGGGGIGWANIRFPGATAYAEVKYRKGTIRVCTVQLQDNDTEVPVVSQIAYRTVEVVANWGVVALAEKFTHSSTDPDDGEVIDGCLDIEALIGPYQIYVYNGSLGTRRVTGELTADGEPPFHKIEFEPTSTIRGVLYDYDGETPVVDATVSLSGGNYAEGGYEIDTDEEGGFAFPMLEKATSYRIDVSHSDGVIRRRLRTGVHVRSAGEVVDIELVLPEQGSVTGQVVRETGVVGDDDVMETEGVPGAVVSMYEVAYPHRRFVQNADNDGYFAFDNIAAGEVTVRAVVPELGGLGGHDRGKIECEAHELILEVVIEPVGEVFGKVINPDDGDPVPNAQVWIVRSGIVDAATSDENGEYRFHFLPVGNYQIRVYDPNTGRNGSSTWFLVGPFQVVQEDTELQVRGNVEGTFFDQSKNEAGDDVLTAIPGSVIRLIPSGWYHATYCSTDHLGGYLFEGIPEGEFDLFAHEDDGRRTASASGEIVAEDETVTVDLVLAATGSVTGVVLNPPGMEPGPFENVNVRVVQGGQVIGASLGSSFEFDGLIAGRRFQLIANEIASLRQAQAYGRIAEVGDEVPPINLTMQAMGSVTVRVTDNDNVDVDEPADVVVYNRHDYGREHFYGSTGGDPEVSFADIREGSLWTRATDPQGLQGSTSGELMEEGETVVLTVKLEDTGTIRGRAVLADGVNPAAFATVALNLQGDWYMTEADEGGNFELESIPMGSYRLIVQEHEGSALIERLGTLTSNGQVDEYGDLLLDGADPYVVSITPPSGTRELDPNTTITIQFSELIDASRSAPAVALRERSGWGTPFQLQWTETEIGSAVTIIPTDTDGDGEALKSGTGYDVDILDGIYDVAGRNMAWRVRSTFYVRDYIPPTVIHMVPADMANQVPVGTAIRVTFSEPVQVVSLSDEAFQLFDLTLNQPVSTQPAFLLDDDPLLTREAIFTHGNLENDHRYQITVKDVLDEGGLSMEESEPVVTTFWTPDETDPSVTWESPEEGADFTAGDNVLMEVVASDDRGLEEVTFTIGEWSTTVVA